MAMKRNGICFMENKRQKLFFLASEIAGKTKKIIPRSVQWKIKNRILKKEIDNYLKKYIHQS